MTIELTKDELQIVHDLIEQRINNLGPEIHHTRTRDYRAALEKLRAQLSVLQDRLEHVTT
jgi:hypothetical protein